MGFYGECWMATDKTALEASLTDPNQQSSKCIGHDYKTCTDSSEHCMGGADSLYIYGFPSAAPARTNEYLLLFLFCFFFVWVYYKVYHVSLTTDTTVNPILNTLVPTAYLGPQEG